MNKPDLPRSSPRPPSGSDGVPVEECVFVDDLRENCAGAEEAGMTAILHRGSEKDAARARAAAGRRAALGREARPPGAPHAQPGEGAGDEPEQRQ